MRGLDIDFGSLFIPLEHKMTLALEHLVLDAEGRYFKPEEVDRIKTYLTTWPDRQKSYQWIRDQETPLVQETLTLLKGDVPGLVGRILELCDHDLRLVLRQCSLAMLLEDGDLVKERLVEWLEDQARLYDLSSTYEIALRHLQNVLKKHLPSTQLEAIRPYVTQVQVALIF
ncbi:MAG: hypothetical protein OHK0012_02250 [Synechococcales cyanobacterium]